MPEPISEQKQRLIDAANNGDPYATMAIQSENVDEWLKNTFGNDTEQK